MCLFGRLVIKNEVVNLHRKIRKHVGSSSSQKNWGTGQGPNVQPLQTLAAALSHVNGYPRTGAWALHLSGCRILLWRISGLIVYHACARQPYNFCPLQPFCRPILQRETRKRYSLFGLQACSRPRRPILIKRDNSVSC